MFGECITTLSSIVQLLMKARIRPLGTTEADVPEDVDTVKHAIKYNEEKDYDFLANGKGDSKETDNNKGLGSTHAMYWLEVGLVELFFGITSIKLYLNSFRLVSPPGGYCSPTVNLTELLSH